MDHYMPPILENISLSPSHEAEEDNDLSSVSDISGDDRLDRSHVTDTLVLRPPSRHESQFDVADVERNLTALPPMPLHHTPRIVSQSVSASSRIPGCQPNIGTKPINEKSRTTFGLGSTNCWICEILALLVSLLALIMIFLILYLYQGRSLQDWPCAITINSVIAIFSTVMRTALLLPLAESVSQAKWDWFHRQEGQILADMEIFDRASRGPWGALRMLTGIRWRHFSTLGAILIILASAIDPMAQQVVLYSQVKRSTATREQNVTIPPSWGFDSNSTEIEPSMKGAVYSGLSGYSFNTSAPPSLSENYTWQYQSLAVCASCTDLTERLRLDHDKYCLPNNVCLHNGDHLKIQSSGLKDIQIVKTSYIRNGSDGQAPHAAECAINWCLKTYGIRADDKSTLVEISSPRQNNSAPQSSFHDGCYNLMPANTSENPFWVDKQSSERISEWMSSIFSTEENPDEASPHNKDKRHPNPGPTKTGHSDSGPRKSDHPDPALNSSSNPILAPVESLTVSFVQKFNSIAAAMTDHIQSAPNPNQPMAFIGKAQISTSQTTTVADHLVVRVQWAWLTLPSVLLLLALILQIATMVRTSRRKTALWKSSTLALFFHGGGVQGGMHSAKGARPDDIAGMEDLARRTKVRLENSGRCWRLTEERRRMV
ncbi:hypothetical protein MMC07_002662 [Pseudocyphellaria aurata]|nr:hypothetical protein [Pseudocyphellaria aurata]